MPPLSTVTNVLISLFVVTSSPGWFGTRSVTLNSPGTCGTVSSSSGIDSPACELFSSAPAAGSILPPGPSNKSCTGTG